ncbi:unnamed protein product [Caenorhabditis bovis]|uniref:Uncharacterized protein n=1 Tax=Caenorhabditis bovis TaxID=2654633 RepID=A0A8S1EII1_9PELO|nr:unnamed protein product [Caenorhabditis bovis]
MVKDDYSAQSCAICSAPADGLHYGAISCRSCNAFFRRTVVEKAKYICKNNNACVIDPDGRCACRSCRFTKCIEAGMKVAAVQPKRDPTGSQRDRRKRKSNDTASMSPSTEDSISQNLEQLDIQSQFYPSSGSYLVDAIKSDFNFGKTRTLSIDSCSAEKIPRTVKTELEEEQSPSTSYPNRFQSSWLNTPLDDDQAEFTNLVLSYTEHQKMMRLSFASVENLMSEIGNGKATLRPMQPEDVSKLSSVELGGLLYWIDKCKPYPELPQEDKDVLLKRFSVRKLSLDHFYVASKHPEHCERQEFVMNNYTYVPSDKTGFELPNEDKMQVEAKRQTFAATFNRFWKNVIRPFSEIKINEAEIVFIQLMLLWSTSNNEHVTPPTRIIMKERRDWAMNRLFEWYVDHSQEDIPVRFGTIIFLFGEVEAICEMHCQDFAVAKLFEFCDMSSFWYESVCYAPCNTKIKNEIDPDLFNSLQLFTASGVLGKPVSHLEAEERWSRLSVSDTQSTPDKSIMTDATGSTPNSVSTTASVRMKTPIHTPSHTPTQTPFQTPIKKAENSQALMPAKVPAVMTTSMSSSGPFVENRNSYMENSMHGHYSQNQIYPTKTSQQDTNYIYALNEPLIMQDINGFPLQTEQIYHQNTSRGLL